MKVGNSQVGQITKAFPRTIPQSLKCGLDCATMLNLYYCTTVVQCCAVLYCEKNSMNVGTVQCTLQQVWY